MFLPAALALVGSATAVTVVSLKRRAFRRRAEREMRSILEGPPSRPTACEIDALPRPVARYHAVAVGDRAPVRAVHLRHDGTFTLRAGGKPLAIRGAQVFCADRPAFIWIGRVDLAPGAWIDARDMFADGHGNMRVLVDDTLAIADASGPTIDQAAALRLLCEMVWYPTALFDPRFVAWAPIDDAHARATLRYGGLEVSADFTFGDDGLPTAARAMRYDDHQVLRPWGGTYRDFRDVAGLKVPFEAIVSWELDQGPYTYAHWLIEAIDYE